MALLIVLLSLSFIALAAVTALALRTFLVQRLDEQLTAAGDRFSVSLEHPTDQDANNTDQLNSTQGQAAGTLGARVLQGTVTAIAVIGRDDTVITAQDRHGLASLQPRSTPHEVHLSKLGEYRVLVSPGHDGDVLVTGLPEHQIDDTIGRLLIIEASVLAGCLLLSATVATLSVRWSLRPLHRVATTALEVSTLPLSTGTVSLPERVVVLAPQTEAGQVAVAFNHMLNHVEASLHERHASEDRLRHFVADASHELRTPVAVIRSHAEYAQRVAAGELAAPVAEALARIAAESDRVGHFVDDLLLLARLDSGRELEHVPLDLTRLVLDVVADARIVGPGHRWRMQLPETEVEIAGDPHRLHQVIANLLANARSHTPPGTRVTTVLNTAPDEVVITVNDNGPGIAPDIIDRIFDRFVRADSARAHPGGSGLGLSIVAALVAAHHGTVEVESKPGDTTFTVRLPR